MLSRQRQSDAPVSASRRLLADVEPARLDAAALQMARGTIRHLASALDQARREGRCIEAENPHSPAAGDTGSGNLCPAADAHAAPHPLSDGANAPDLAPKPDQQPTPSIAKTTPAASNRAAICRCLAT